MATLNPQSVTHAGLVPTYTAATSGGDACPTGSGVLLAVKNGDSASHTVTLVTPGTVDGLAVADRTVTVAASATVFIPIADVYPQPCNRTRLDHLRRRHRRHGGRAWVG